MRSKRFALWAALALYSTTTAVGQSSTSDDRTSEEEGYILVFSDEFDASESAPDLSKWNYSTVGHGITWKRFVAQTPEGRAQTAFVKDGELVTRCLANTLEDEKDGNGNRQEMISGAIESAETFAFTYGKVEARLKTKPLIGNFPAFWMMPLDNSAGWPAGGEIDIWEQIDGQSISYHTIHSKWANGAGDGGLGNNYNPPKSGSHRTTNGEYHTFGLEWKENVLIWFVDGEQVFSYAKSDSQDDLDKGQWPFDKPFYLILNQSVGNGSWAMNYDKRFVYETVFDYVRVYQKEGQTNTSINDLKNKADRLDFYPSPGRILIVSPERQAVSVTDIEGRIHFEKEVQGNRTIRLPKGVYILNGRKAIVP